MRLRILPPEFFQRPVLAVAPDLLGRFLVREEKGERHLALITETEAYDGPEDLACHASRGRTPRTEPMFAAGGRWYVYLVYGMHWMLNIVTGPADYPAAVLIRGVVGAGGPGRVTKKFGITRVFNNLPAAKATGLYFAEEVSARPRLATIRTLPRVGVDYAGPIWKNKPWRFVLDLTEK